MKQGSSISTYQFQPHQIACLEQDTTRLYAEVLDVVEWRQICWLRPWILTQSEASQESSSLYDLRQSPDLLWPSRSLRLALDIEVIPLLVQLEDSDREPNNYPEAHYQLNSFISKVWRTHQGKV